MARAVDSGDVRAGLIIPAGYERALARGEKVKVGFVIDGSDPSVATTALSAAQGVGQAQSIEVLNRRCLGGWRRRRASRSIPGSGTIRAWRAPTS